MTIEEVEARGVDSASRRFRPWRDGAICIIDDEEPFLRLKVAGGKLSAARGTDTSVLVKDDLDVWKWHPIPPKSVSTDRAFGAFELPLAVPAVTLRAYVLPRRLLDPPAVLRMAEDIRHELGLSIWSDDVSPRTWSSASARWRPLDESDLALVRRELHGARDLLRAPSMDLGPRWVRAAGAPEVRLVPAWAQARGRALQVAVTQAEGDLRRMDERARRRLPPARAKERVEQWARRASFAEEARRLRVEVLALGAQVGTAAGLTLTPSMQRDHRLRRLLAALSPPMDEQVVMNEAALSHLPPMRLPRLFEVWCAVWLARTLRSAGFVGTAEPVTAAGGAVACCRWALVGRGIRLVLEYEPDPERVEDTPSTTCQREQSALEWAAGHSAPVGWFGLDASLSPDFGLRAEGPGGRVAFALGDATLSDPERGGKELEKIRKVDEYAKTIAWNAGGTAVMSTARTSFVLVPGPAERWSDHERLAAIRDCHLLPVHPTAADDTAGQRLRTIVDRLVRAIST